MRLILLVPLLVVWTACHAESPIVTDLKNLYRFRRDWQPSGLSIEAYRSRMDIIRSRARPIVTEEFAKLAVGEISPLARELLNDQEAMEFCWAVLLALFPTFTAEEQVMGVNAMFTASPESYKGYVVLTLLFRLPKESLSGAAIQKWIVDHINAGMHAGAFYFILTEDSAVAVSKVACRSMRRFSKKRGACRQNLFSLISAAFLASRNDEEALAFLGSLLDNRSIESTLDRMYVIPAAAMSGHRQLVQRIIDIVKTDKRTHWNGEDCVPRESSFAHAAANACSFVIEDFPPIGFWSEYDEEMRKKVVNWIGENHAYVVHGNPAAILKLTPFNEVVTGMLRQFDK